MYLNIIRKYVNLTLGSCYEISLLMPSCLVEDDQVAPSMYIPVTRKEFSSTIEPSCRSILSSSSSSDQELTWLTYCLVAVRKASGNKRPPSHTPC